MLCRFSPFSPGEGAAGDESPSRDSQETAFCLIARAEALQLELESHFSLSLLGLLCGPSLVPAARSPSEGSRVPRLQQPLALHLQHA